MLEVVIGIVGIAAGALFSWLISRHYYRCAESSSGEQFDMLRRLVAAPRRGDEGAPVDFAAVAYADVTNEGSNKLLIQHHSGPNGRGLKVYDFDSHALQLKLVAEVHTTLPAGFTVGDLDDDGQLEVATVDIDWERSNSHADPAHVELLYRWEDGDFKVVAQRDLRLPGVGSWEPSWYDGPIGPSPGYGAA
jgi:hypothetical protein